MLQEEIQAVLGIRAVLGIQAGVESLIVEQTQAEQEKLTVQEIKYKKKPLCYHCSIIFLIIYQV